MSGFFSKLVGLFVERVPLDEHGRPTQTPTPAPVQPPRGAPPVALPTAPQQFQQPQAPPPPHMMNAPQQMQVPAQQQMPSMPQQHQPNLGAQAPVGAVPASPAAPTIAVALRAVVPQEYAAHLAPYGLHVLAAGGDVTSEQARGWGAQVLVISADCLGRELHLLQTPQLPTVFIAPQPVMIPEQPGVVQVHEPLHASDVARAVREAAQAWAAAGRSASN